jgi:hypothetical protein
MKISQVKKKIFLKKEEKIKMIFFKILITGNKITFFQKKK